MRILIVGTNRPCHYPLHNLGHETVLLVKRGRLVDEDLAKQYRDIIALDDAAPLAEWLNIASALHRSKPFDAVVSYIDTMQEMAQTIASQLGVFCTVDSDLVRAVADKSTMRKILDEMGIPSCRHALCLTEEEMRSAIAEIGFPCIVKPVDGEGSAGVSKVASNADIGQALQRLGNRSLETGILVEEFLAGDEYSVESISVDGRHHIVAVTKKYKDPITFVECGHVVPAPLEKETRANIVHYVCEILTAFNFMNCASHTELILTENGPRIVETHTRNGGDKILDLVLHATGIDLNELIALQSIGMDIEALLPTEINVERCAAVWFAAPNASDELTLTDVKGIEEVNSLPYVRLFEFIRKPGTSGTSVKQSMDRTALIVTVAETVDEAVYRAKSAICSLKFNYAWRSSNS